MPQHNSRRFSSSRPFNKSHSSGNRFSHKFSNKSNRKSAFAAREFSDISKFINKAIITEEAPVFVPEHQFGDFHIDERLKKNIAAKGYVLPTPIQDRSI